MAIPNRIKNLDGFHGRLFVEREDAENWLSRLQRKLGHEYAFEVKENINIDDDENLVLAFIYRKEEE